MSTLIQPTSEPTSSRVLNAPETMSIPAKFIGAVEDEWQLYSDRAEDYTIGEPIGFGASSIVYSAGYKSIDEPSSKSTPCALKVLDLDKLPPRSLQLLQRETTLMSLSKHPNVLRVRGSWIDGHKLYIALRLMNKGSAADVMRYGWPGGMEEDVVRCILRQALKGLNYLHINGFIHRDIKAANLLIDDDGTVLLGDLGVAADLAEDTSHVAPSPHTKFSITSPSSMSQFKSSSTSSTHSGGSTGKRAVLFDEAVPAPARPKVGKRKSFVGTPCWMAPELIQGKQYDSKADIWSFGITALELTQGRPPRSRESPQRVLLRTIQEDPPTLNRDGGTYKYSRAFKDIIDWCLNKDPAKRPTAEGLLQSPFFKSAKKHSYLINTILKDLPPLTQRQERRALASATFANSVDSWDFATTVHSPHLAALRKRISEGHDDVTIQEVFQMEEENADVDSMHSHSRTVSWRDPHFATLDEAKPKSIMASSPSTSSSSVHTSGLDEIPPAPSSDTDGSDVASEESKSESASSGAGLTSIAEHDTHSSHTAPRQPSFANSISIRRRLSNSSSQTSSSSGSPGKRSLWQKLKTNVKGPSPSSGGEGAADSSPEGSSKKGKISGIFAGSNKSRPA
ncbi:kinase-like domain-containing protein [Crepidotus variabilis]|uniref:Kinase-like domain-containing protein n=1 Tax=Crepidotus variabilis TaxID=179855 RepID=A0A9P6JWD0_9AGAR|nr:kinase-like domain-containing protein [Crepidotus variabilis]